MDTSNGLLLTVLGEFVLPRGGGAWTQTLLALLELLDVRDKAARQSLARMYQRGWLDREKVGRQVRWLLTDRSRALLEPGARRIYRFGQRTPEWDGSWIVVLASVPESERKLRYRMTSGLNWAGFGSLGQGVWISPWLEQERAAVELLGSLAIDATTFRATLGDLGSPRAIASEAWDLAALRSQYESFLSETRPRLRRPPSDGAAAAELTLLVHHWRRFPFLDPDLPGALLPLDWPGPRAARRFAELREVLSAPAADWWDALEADLTRSS